MMLWYHDPFFMSAYLDLLKSIVAPGNCVREDGPAARLVLPDELHLQALWFAGQMGREFLTVDGKNVRIIQFGHWNHAAGPDFLHTAVEIDGEKFAGSLELDHCAANWESHGHAENETFNDVVLHVVFEPDTAERFTRTVEHKEVPRVCVPESVIRAAMDLPLVEMADAHPGRCFQPLADMEVQYVDALLLEAVKHRAEKKILRRQRVTEVLGEDEWLWQAFAETLGYRPNKLAMTLLAQRFPSGQLLQSPDSMEAVLFGAAGFLSVDIHKEAAADSQDYLRTLWESWWQVRSDYELTAERAIPWKFSGIRPINHPQRRLACLVQVAKRWEEFKSLCLEQTGAAGIQGFFQNLNHPFWSHHYTLKSKRSDKALVLMGRDRLQDFQINHLLPANLAAGDKWAWEIYQKLPAPAVSEKVEKASVRLFGDTPRRKNYLKRAWQHQALLQIYQDFCLRDVSDCAECPFPEQLAQWQGC